MRQNRNKGMAFISVVIAIMFIGLLATSLTYMAYSNYISKSTRWQTSDHFYYDEFALDELSSAIRQKGTEKRDAICAADDTLDPTKVLIQEMAKASGMTTDNGDYNSTASGTWNPATMTQLLKDYGVTDNTNIEVKVDRSDIPGRTDPLYTRNKKDIKFSNVQITIHDKRNDYTTVITTDIHIPAEPKGSSIPVNEFSLMTDSPFVWNKGGMVTFQGNLFCMDKAAPPHTDAAMTIDQGSNITVAGKQSMIVGDLYVKGNSIISLGGNTTITGTVHVESGSIVDFRGSDVKIGGLDNSGMVTGYYEVDSELTGRAGSVFDSTGTYSAGLASAIADDVTIIVAGTNASDIKTVTFCKTNATYGTGLTQVSSSQWVVAHPNGSLAAATTYMTGTNPTDNNRDNSAKTQLRPISDDITGATDQLLFMTKNPNNIRGDYSNTTMICTSTNPMQSGDNSTAPFMTKLNNEAYNSCLKSWMGASGQGVYLPNISAGNMETNFTGGHFYVPTTKYEDLVASTPSNYIKIPMSHLGSEERWMLYNTSVNKPCMPWGYFIRDDADDIIGFAFTNVRDDQSNGSEMQICYENWVKE